MQHHPLVGDGLLSFARSANDATVDTPLGVR
jgi:hypothetical protein